MNSSFLQDVFASESFRRDYKEYLDTFDEVMQDENEKKFDKFITFIEESIAKNKINVSNLIFVRKKKKRLNFFKK